MPLDQPENVWRSYIDLEVANGHLQKAHDLYERLLDKSKHVKVWLSYAWHMLDQAHSIEGARAVMNQALSHFKDKEPELKEERLMLLENWLQLEQRACTDQVDKVKVKFPKRVKKRRKLKIVDSATGQDVTGEEEEGWEEYYDYVFPEDEAVGPAKNLKILQMAHKWKEAKA